jgi:hypothetical protein
MFPLRRFRDISGGRLLISVRIFLTDWKNSSTLNARFKGYNFQTRLGYGNGPGPVRDSGSGILYGRQQPKMTTDAETPRPITRIQREKQEVILEAALDVFSQFGFRGSTIDQIAEAAVPGGAVIPTMARGARAIAAATGNNELGGAALYRALDTGRQARIGEHDVGPGLEVLGDAEIVERKRKDIGIGLYEFIGQLGCQLQGRSLAGGALLGCGVGREYRIGPGRGGQRAQADFAPGKGDVCPIGDKCGLERIGDGAGDRALIANGGVEAKERGHKITFR